MRTRPIAVLAILPICLVASCTAEIDGVARAAPSVPAGLEQFYAQQPEWRSCGGTEPRPSAAEDVAADGLECTSVEVPLDYSAPTGRKAEIALLRRPAHEPDERIGSLLLNPGGPGMPGRDLAALVSADSEGTPLGDHFDLVGFDPRGVGASVPSLRCLTDEEIDVERLDLDLDTSPAGVAQTEQEARDYADKCAERVGRDVLANSGTVDVARDLDIIRAVLGDEKLNYLGFSYGTFIGTKYAEQFPDNVRALVLDGAVDPNVSDVDDTLNQLTAFQASFTAFVAECVRHDECWTKNPATADRDFQHLLGPLRVSARDIGDRKLSYNDAITGTLASLYSSEYWPALNEALVEFAAGGGDLLLQSADDYLGREETGYAGNHDAFTAIDCVDAERITDPEVLLDGARRAQQAVPFLDDGTPPVAIRGVCNFWPVPPTSTPGVPDVEGLPTTMVISTVGDPATPYADGVALARQLGARLLTYEGQQHTIALEGHPCVDGAVEEYLVDLVLPPDGLRCPE